MKTKKSLYLICEGLTEKLFVEKLKSTFESKYDSIEIVNANGKDKIVKKYKNIKRINDYDINIMCDLDGKKSINDIIKVFKDNGVKIDKKDIYFINPTFELIFVMCKLKKVYISGYPKHIKDIYGVEEYDKHEDQIKAIIKQINKEDIIFLMNNMKRFLSHIDTETRSSNYDVLFNKLFKIE